jgi:myo-inositol-1(or 4)-monophosphatase
MLGEEASFLSGLTETQALKKGGQWILDPLDGTTNYVHGFYVYSISLALEWDGEIIYGIVDVPALKQTYWAIRGQGAFKDGVPIHVSSRNTLAEALLVTGFASSRPAVLQRQVNVFTQIVDKVRGLRRTGSAAYDLCLVAEGVFDGYWESDLSAWDTAAGALIVEEAGGSVTNTIGEKFNPHRRDVAAANPEVHKKMIELLSSVRPVKK